MWSGYNPHVTDTSFICGFIWRRLNTRKADRWVWFISELNVGEIKSELSNEGVTEIAWQEIKPVHYVYITSMSKCNPDQIKSIHCQSRHSDVQQTLFFIKLIAHVVFNVAMKAVVRGCQECQSIDPSPAHWKKGEMDVTDWVVWTLLITIVKTTWCQLIVVPHGYSCADWIQPV